MEAELLSLDEQMKNEIKECKDKYSLLKKQVREKYKNIEKEKKKLEKEELKKLRKSIPKTLRNKVWDTTIGKEKGVGDCFVCNTNIDSKNFECGHIISVKEGGETTLENLKPICGCCNKSMGIKNLIEFKEKYFPQIKENKPDIPNNSDSKVVEFIKNNITSCNNFNSFLSLDDIHAKYFKWLSFKYEDYYSDVKFSGCFGEPDGLSELKSELSKLYGEFRSNPMNHDINDFIMKEGYGFMNIKYI